MKCAGCGTQLTKPKRGPWPSRCPDCGREHEREAKAKRRQARAEEACKEHGHSCEIGRCTLCGEMVAPRTFGLPSAPSEVDLKTRMGGERPYGTPDRDQVKAAFERMRAARDLTDDERKWLDRVAPWGFRPMEFERESRHMPPLRRPLTKSELRNGVDGRPETNPQRPELKIVACEPLEEISDQPYKKVANAEEAEAA
jgi:hypothetical protein